MLTLLNTTLIAIDSFRPDRTLRVMAEIQRQIKFAAAVLVTRNGFGKKANVEVLEKLEDDSRMERERFLATRLSEAFFTPFALHVEWDSGVKNVLAWQPNWIQFDFIGAPWRPSRLPGFPPITESMRVGNTGFCLISQRFADLQRKLAKPTDRELAKSDVYTCVVLRPVLEKHGIRFAPPTVAARFSCEDCRYDGQFGWHGKGTANLNRFPLPS